jgi:thiamine-phosphate pyrophosphorylase
LNSSCPVRESVMKQLDENEKGIVLRILDANANRCAEGLRVIEEGIRLGRDNQALQSRLKDIRHGVRRGLEAICGSAMHFRDSDGDVGRGTVSRSEMLRGSLEDVARANFARAEEALRVLEEYGKLVDASAALGFKELRFELYSVERDFFTGFGSRAELPISPFIYAILDRSVVTDEDFEATVRALTGGGVDIVQYRAKEKGPDERRRDLVILLAAAGTVGIPVIVNDDPELAAEVGAQGVHLGAADPSPGEARALLGAGAIIGVTIHSMDELIGLDRSSIDYLAVGSIFPSPTKRNVRLVGTGFIESVVQRAEGMKIVAIGGINENNIASVFDAGADGAAMISAILSGDVSKNCFTFKEIVARRRV